jgi:signal transduction histidine kinase
MQFQIIPKLLQDIRFPEQDRFVGLFQKSLRQLVQVSNLVDDLLDISRISSGHLLMDLQPVKLSEVASRVLDQYGPDLESAGCEVNHDFEMEISGLWDPIRVEQVMVNLLTNAMKYGAGKPIELETRSEGDRAILSVRDHGIGISQGDQAKIFERFERAAPVTKYRGLGLGLYITRQIVETLGGTIRVESDVGKGSTFTVELPLRQASSEDAKAAA